MLAACGGGGGSDAASSAGTESAAQASAAAVAADAAAAAAAQAPSSDTSTAQALSVASPNGGGSVPTIVASKSSNPAPTTVTTVPPVKTSLTAHSTSVNMTANGYFVDSAAGNDSNPGTVSAPFQTLARLNSLRLTTGQGIYLHCGGVWRETLTLGTVQLVNGSTIAQYGTACDTTPPRVTGADDFSGGWTLSNGIWSRSVPAGTPKIARLFINGQPLHTAQWPNAATSGSNYLLEAATAPTSTTQIQMAANDLAALPSTDLVGAVMRVREQPWVIDDRTISTFNVSTGTAATTTATTYPMQAKAGYVLMDKLWMLDEAGEFYPATTANKLYLIAPTASVQAALNSAVVEAPVRANAITIYGRTGVTVQGLSVDMASGDGIALGDLNNGTASGITASHNGRSGIRVYSSVALPSGMQGMTLTQSVANDNIAYGVDASTAHSPIITNVTATETGTQGWTGASLAGIWSGDGAQVSNNVVHDSGYLGIRFSGSGGAVIKNNSVTGYCLMMSDCGGIYTWNGTQLTSGQTSSVLNNQVGGATPNTAGAVGTGIRTVSAIYLDDFSRGVTVRGNTVAGSPIGIYIHNGSNNTVDANNVWLTTDASIYANNDQPGPDVMINNTFTNNQLVPATAFQGTYPQQPYGSTSLGIRYTTTQATTADITSGSNLFSGNAFVPVQGTSLAAVQVLAGGSTTNYSVHAWQQLSPNDGVGSTPVAFNYISETFGSELQTPSAFAATLAPSWTTYIKPGSNGTAQIVNGLSGCAGYCAMLTSGSTSDILYGLAYPMTSGALYSIRYTEVPLGAATLAQPMITQSVSPWASVTGPAGMTTVNPAKVGTGDVLSVEYWFTSSMTSPARTNLKNVTLGVPVAYGNVSVRAVTGYSLAAVSDWAGVAQSAPATTTTVSCATFGWPSTCTATDLAGNAISFPYTVPAGSAEIFLRTDSSWHR